MAGLDRIAVHSLICAGLDCVIHVERLPGGRRCVQGIYALERGADAYAAVREIAVTRDGRTHIGERGQEFIDGLKARRKSSR